MISHQTLKFLTTVQRHDSHIALPTPKENLPASVDEMMGMATRPKIKTLTMSEAVAMLAEEMLKEREVQGRIAYENDVLRLENNNLIRRFAKYADQDRTRTGTRTGSVAYDA